jgi:hypothetical protein
MVRLSPGRVAELETLSRKVMGGRWLRRFDAFIKSLPRIARDMEYPFLMNRTPENLVAYFIEYEAGVDWFNERTKADWLRQANAVYDRILESVKGG